MSIAVAAAGGCDAAEPTVNFNIASKPLSKGLVDFAVQAKVSIGLGGLSSCTDPKRPLVGRFTIDKGLARLLSGSGCGFQHLDAQAFAITPLALRHPGSARVRGAPLPMDSPDLSELVVVATRRSTPAERLAYSVSQLSGRSLRDAGVRDIGDLALISPAMAVTNLGMGRDKVLLRGLSDGPLTGLTQSPVALYLDDVRLTYNAPDPDLPLVDLERVEVVRGPQGALYGAGSLGGVVHLVSVNPDSRRLSAWAASAVGWTLGGGVSHSVDGVLNLPLISDKAGARIVFYHEVFGGYIHNDFLDIDRTNEAERNGGRLMIDFKLDDRWSVSAGALVNRITSADTQYTTPDEPPYTRANKLREPQNNDLNEYNVNVNGIYNWAIAHLSVAYIQHNISSRYDATIAPPVRTLPGPAAFDIANHIKTIVSEWTLSSPPQSRVQWLAGLFYAHTDESSHSSQTSENSPPFLAYRELRQDTLNEGAFYGEATTPINWGFKLTTGGRLFASRDHVSSVDTSFIHGASAPFAGNANQVGFAPKIVLSKQISRSTIVYGQAAQGYRSPGINTAAAPTEKFSSAGGAEPNRMFKSDQLWSYEIGAKFNALDGRLRVNVAGFEARWKNIQSDQLLPSGLPFTANVGDGRNLGLELEGTYRLGSLELRAEMLINHPVLSRANRAFPLLAQVGLGIIPDASFGLRAHYAWRLDDRRSLGFDGHWTYVGSSNLMLNVAKVGRMGDYATGRLAISIVDERWRLSLAVDNPADVEGNTFAYGNPFTIRFKPQTTPLRPRTISMGVEASF